MSYQTRGQSSSQVPVSLPPPERLPVQPIDLSTFKGLKYVQLDPMVLETREIYDTVSGTFQWKLFQNSDESCVNYIQQECANRRVFLITTGSMGKKVVPIIHDLPQLYAIYIFCADIQSHEQWALQYRKVRIVCNDDDKYLLPLFAVDTAQAFIEWADALVQAGRRDKAKEKYEKALSNLSMYTRFQDVKMLNDVKQKLEQMK